LTLGRGGYRLSVAQNQKVKINGISFTAKNNSEVLANYENDKPMVKVVSGEVDVLPLELGAPATVAHQGQSVPVNVRVVAGPSPIALSNQSPTGTPASTAMAASSPTSSASPVPTATQAPSPIPVATATTAPARKKVLPKPTPSPTPKKKAKKMLQFKVIREYNNGDAGGATGGQ
jgi:cell division septation protein DedD